MPVEFALLAAIFVAAAMVAFAGTVVMLFEYLSGKNFYVD